FRAKARSLGVEYVAGEVTAIDCSDGRVNGVRFADGRTISSDWVVNATGPRAASVAAMVGAELPVHPRKRYVYHFDCRQRIDGAPLTIHTTGAYFRPEAPNIISHYSPRAARTDSGALYPAPERPPV